MISSSNNSGYKVLLIIVSVMVILLFGATQKKWPYGYYTLLRCVVFLGSISISAGYVIFDDFIKKKSYYQQKS